MSETPSKEVYTEDATRVLSLLGQISELENELGKSAYRDDFIAAKNALYGIVNKAILEIGKIEFYCLEEYE